LTAPELEVGEEDRRPIMTERANWVIRRMIRDGIGVGNLELDLTDLGDIAQQNGTR